MYTITYTGDAVETEFPFTFPFFQNADVRVALNEEMVLDNTGVYSIVPNEDFTGGTVVFAVAPDKGVRIDIFRQIALSRIIDYQPTAQIDPECLNSDFNFLLAAFQDLRGIDLDVVQWKLVHSKMVDFLEYTTQLVQDKLSGGGVLGLYNNLVGVLASAQPYLINDYGSVAEAAPNETRDDYGIL